MFVIVTADMVYNKIFYSFRCLLTTMQQHPKTVQSIVMACCILHNFLRQKYPNDENADHEHPVTHAVVPGAWRQEQGLTNLQILQGNTSTKAGKSQREYLREYFMSDVGSVPWQESMI